MKKTLLICASIFAGCATTQTTASTGGMPARTGYCSISEPGWAAANRDFDRATTIESIAGLTEAANADRDRLHAGARDDVGARLDQLYRTYHTTAFVSQGVAELGTRLRQLDCAVQHGSVEFAKADQLYAQILAELAVEKSTLEPGPGTARSAAP
jgi:hypothetical protein